MIFFCKTKTFWFCEPEGIKVFQQMGNEYYKIHDVYPTTLHELPKFVTSLGYRSKGVVGTMIESPGKKRERIGLRMSAKDALAFKLKWL